MANGEWVFVRALGVVGIKNFAYCKQEMSLVYKFNEFCKRKQKNIINGQYGGRTRDLGVASNCY
jgi:hypothetical protein